MKIKFNNMIKKLKEKIDKVVLIRIFLTLIIMGAFSNSYNYLLLYYFGIIVPSKFVEPLNIYVVIYVFLSQGLAIGLQWLIKVIQKFISRKKP